MIAEKDLRALLINDAAKQWWTKNIAGTTGWLYDWDGEEWAVANRAFFLSFLLAFDSGIREDYLRKKRQNKAADAPDNFDESFLTELFKRRRQQGNKVYARTVATIYFHNDDALLDWVQNVYLNLDSKWTYNADRDDVFLAELLGNAALRIKAPRLVERVFLDVVAPFLGSLRFLYANKKYEYQKVDFLTDVCQRLLGRDGRRIDAANAIEYWLKERPCKTLQEWFKLEAYRELERAIKQRQRARMAERLLTGELLYRERKAAERPVERPISIDIQNLFDKFYAASPESATLCAAYWGTDSTFSELSNFYNVDAAKPIDGKTLCKRYGRALDVFKGVCENALQIPEIPQERWKRVVKIFSKIDEQTNDQEETTKNEEKAPWKKGAPNNDAWRMRLRFVTEPTEEDKALLVRILEMRRCDDTACFRAFVHENTQGGGFATTVSLPVRRISAPGEERTQGSKVVSGTGDVYQNHPRSCGAPVLVYDPAAFRRYWRNKYSENRSIIFYFESTEKPGAPLYWVAEARCPIADIAEPNAEISVVFSGYRPLVSAPCEATLGKIKAPCVQGVAVFKLSDFRAEIERNALQVTMNLRHCAQTDRWHVKQVTPGRLLFRKPVVRDDE